MESGIYVNERVVKIIKGVLICNGCLTVGLDAQIVL